MKKYIFLAVGVRPIIGYAFDRASFHAEQLHALGLPYGVSVRCTTVRVAG